MTDFERVDEARKWVKELKKKNSTVAEFFRPVLETARELEEVEKSDSRSRDDD